MDFTLQIGNSVGLWIACIPVLAVIIGQVILIYRKARVAMPLVDLSKEEASTAFRTGLVTAIGPSFASFISIIAMSAVMGGPVTWMRTSIIASASTELRACTYTAEAAEVVLGPGMSMQIFDACLWVMAINGCGWLLFCFLFTDKMSIVTNKISGGSTAMMSAFATSAVLGTICYMSSSYIKGVFDGAYAPFVGMVIGALSYFLINLIAKKVKGLKAWNFGISLLIGMIGAEIFNTMTAVAA